MSNNKDYARQITDYINQEIRILNKLDYSAINEVINILEMARERVSTVYICGNGGSAATASHFVCDFNKGVSYNKEKKYNFICLNDNIPSVMAIANDCGYEEIFVQQLKGRMKAEDVLLCISGSGNSKNVLLAAEYAKSLGVIVIGATGYDGGLLYKLSDYHLHVPVDNMQTTEDIHMIFDHLIMWILTHGN
ncbi:MAG: SIS domain-containing protein [Termitinemataceae bacterium]|nr:MAG: SIS domain-containing protein [Termitinemataceae bacterium]